MSKQYPKWIYHRTEKAKIVDTPEDHAAAGPDWHTAPVGPETHPASTEPPPPAGSIPNVPVSPDPPAPVAPSTEDQDAAADEAEAAGLYAADVALVIEKLAGAPREVLEKVRRFELANPAGPRPELVAAVDAALVPPAPPVEAAKPGKKGKAPKKAKKGAAE